MTFEKWWELEQVASHGTLEEFCRAAYETGMAAQKEKDIETVHTIVSGIPWGWDGDCNVAEKIERAIEKGE